MMFEITDKHDFKLGYKLLGWLKENNKRDAYNELKLKLRLFAQEVSDVVVVKEERGQTWCKKVLPVKSMDDAREWFDENERVEPYNSMYDCTGQEFTGWCRIFRVKDKWLCYHYIARDL